MSDKRLEVEHVRVMRVITIAGPRDRVEQQVRRSLHGTKVFGAFQGPEIEITAHTITEFPEIDLKYVVREEVLSILRGIVTHTNCACGSYPEADRQVGGFKHIEDCPAVSAQALVERLTPLVEEG